MGDLMLKWDKFRLFGGLHAMFKCRELVDITLVCEGEIIQAHKSVLAACSPHFKRIFMTNPCQHPIVIMQDVRLQHLRSLLEFMYTGQAKVKQAEMKRFMKTAEALKVSGLACNEANDSQDNTELFDLCDEDEPVTRPTLEQVQVQQQSQQEQMETSTQAIVNSESFVESTFEVEEQQVIIADDQSEAQQAVEWLKTNADLGSHGVSFRLIPEPPSIQPQQRKFQCSRCTSAVFTTEHYLNRHIKNVHSAPSDISCDFCHQGFKSHSKLEQHVALHHLGRLVDNRYQCALCDKNYKSKKELLKHQKYKHENLTEDVSCGICHKKFKYQDTLRCHMRKKHGQYNRPRKQATTTGASK